MWVFFKPVSAHPPPFLSILIESCSDNLPSSLGFFASLRPRSRSSRTHNCCPLCLASWPFPLPPRHQRQGHHHRTHLHRSILGGSCAAPPRCLRCSTTRHVVIIIYHLCFPANTQMIRVEYERWCCNNFRLCAKQRSHLAHSPMFCAA